MPAFDEAPILELGRSPIPGANPCGVDAADDQQYIDILAQVAGVDRIEADEPEWYVIEESGAVLLKDKTKDADIASALGHALFKRYSYAGLAAALGLFTELVKNFWENMYPARPRRRKARLEVLTDRFSEQGWFRDNQPKPDEFDAIDLCVTRIVEFEAAIKEKMPDDEADVAKFVRGIKELAGRRPKPVAPTPAAPVAGDGAAPATSAPVATDGGGIATQEINDVSGAVNALLSAATFIRKADDANPLPYAIVRIIKWSKVALPSSDQAKFQIPKPEGPIMDTLSHQFNNQMWDKLLKNAEGAFRSNDPFWLDLQRYVCEAMRGLGPNYEKARYAVMGVTGGLINRLGEGLYELTFKDGTPLCSGETKMWIDSEVAAGGGGDGGGSAAGDNGRLAEASAKAKKLAGAGKLKEALAELQGGLRACTQRRDRFLWRVRIAQLCFDAKRFRIATPLLEECQDEIKRFRVDEWEPLLAVDVAQTLYRCRKSVTAGEKSPAPEVLKDVRDTFAWLCQLDPLAALAAEPSSK